MSWTWKRLYMLSEDIMSHLKLPCYLFWVPIFPCCCKELFNPVTYWVCLMYLTTKFESLIWHWSCTSATKLIKWHIVIHMLIFHTPAYPITSICGIFCSEAAIFSLTKYHAHFRAWSHTVVLIYFYNFQNCNFHVNSRSSVSKFLRIFITQHINLKYLTRLWIPPATKCFRTGILWQFHDEKLPCLKVCSKTTKI